MFQEEGWIELLASNNEYEARLIIGLLESNGVKARLKSFRVSQFPFDIGHIGELKVMVRPNDLDEANKILKNVEKDIKIGQDGDGLT